MKKTQINKKVFHANGLEDLILLKSPCYSKQSTDSVRFSIKIPTNFFFNSVGKTGHPHAKRIQLYCCLMPYTKINSKWIKDLNVRPEIIKLLEENICSNFLDIGLGDEFLYLKPKVKVMKGKIGK